MTKVLFYMIPISDADGNVKKIRLATGADLERVFGVVHAAIRHMDSQGIPQWDEIYPDRTILQEDIQKEQMYVIEVCGRIAGLITINEDQAPEYDMVPWRYNGRIMVVHRLTIHPDHQRLGLATMMMEFAERMAEKNGYSAIRLDAFTLNPVAAGMYRKLGYKNPGTIKLRKGMFFCFEKQVYGQFTKSNR